MYNFFYKKDEIWLKILNNERRKEKLGELNADLFENIIDQLEKEWFDLVSFYYCHYYWRILFMQFYQ